jgi:membrane protein DedA with SNARE-associated domain
VPVLQQEAVAQRSPDRDGAAVDSVVAAPAASPPGAPAARAWEPDRHHGGMHRLRLPLSTLVLLAVLKPHHGGSGVDYIGVFVASAASWALLPGPGEAALIAAGISAARGHLDLASVIAVAWAGATVGGTAGWVLGVKGGRGLLMAPGPLIHVRLGLIARGDRFYERYGPVAVFFTPSWIAGVHDMRWPRFLPANALSALTWALSIGLGAYLVGPSITDIVADAGLAGGALLAALFVFAVVLVLRRRSHRSARSEG